jgi:HEAT repeat protein
MAQNEVSATQDKTQTNTSLLDTFQVVEPINFSQNLDAVEETADKGTVQSLIDDLKDGNSEVRLASIRALRKAKSKNIVELLIPMLKDSSSDVRLEAINLLSEIGDKKAVKPLISCLNNGVSDCREASAIALGLMPDPISVHPLIRALKDTYSWVRAAAAFSLGRIHSEECVEPLIQCLSDVNYVVQIRAAESLGNFNNATSATSLINKLRGSTSHPRKREERDDHEQIRRLELIYNYHDESGVKEGKGRFLIPDKKVFNSLMHDDKKVNYPLRKVCAESLGIMKNKKAVKPLIEALDDPRDEVCIAAAWALGSIKDGRAVDPLSKKLKEGNSEIRQAAARALGEIIYDPRSKKSLLAARKDKDKRVKVAAKQALEKLGSQ